MKMPLLLWKTWLIMLILKTRFSLPLGHLHNISFTCWPENFSSKNKVFPITVRVFSNFSWVNSIPGSSQTISYPPKAFHAPNTLGWSPNPFWGHLLLRGPLCTPSPSRNISLEITVKISHTDYRQISFLYPLSHSRYLRTTLFQNDKFKSIKTCFNTMTD